MAESEPTHADLTTGGARANGEATQDLEVLCTIDGTAFADTRHH